MSAWPYMNFFPILSLARTLFFPILSLNWRTRFFPDSFHAFRFNDLNNLDKLASVQTKVDNIKVTMQDNISKALANTDKIEDIDEKAVTLSESANKFKNMSGSLKNSMRCRYIKMIIIITLLVAAVLAVIIVPIVINNQKSS